MMLSGLLLIAFSDKSTSYLLYPAMSLIASGGIAVLIANMQVSTLYNLIYCYAGILPQ